MGELIRLQKMRLAVAVFLRGCEAGGRFAKTLCTWILRSLGGREPGKVRDFLEEFSVDGRSAL